MLATRGETVPTTDAWVHEVKWDGVRLLGDLGRRGARFTTRNENDVSGGYPELQTLAEVTGGRDLLLDGEVVVLADGRPSFGALAERMHVRDARRLARLRARLPVTYLVFDLLRLDGRDLHTEPWTTRRELLESLELADAWWQVPDVYDDGPLLLEATRQQQLEGVVSKRRSSRYVFGSRSPHWQKFPHRHRTSCVVGGWRHETDSRTRLGALLLGQPTAEGLAFRGRVGSGVTGPAARRLKELLEPLRTAEPPFLGELPRADVDGTTWVTPRVVVEVESLGAGSGGRLRQPSFQGVRDDLTPEDLLASEAETR